MAASVPSSARIFTDPWGNRFGSTSVKGSERVVGLSMMPKANLQEPREQGVSSYANGAAEGTAAPAGKRTVSSATEMDDRASGALSTASSVATDDKGSYRAVGRAVTSGKTLPKIRLKVQGGFDDPESEEETQNHSFSLEKPKEIVDPITSGNKSKASKSSTKSAQRAKAEETISIRDPPCWRCKTLNEPCQASSLRSSCNTCYKRHWACTTNPPPPRSKKGSIGFTTLPTSVSAPVAGTHGKFQTNGISSISTRGRSPNRDNLPPARVVKRPRSPSAPEAPPSPHNKKTRTGLRSFAKPQPHNIGASTSMSSALVPSMNVKAGVRPNLSGTAKPIDLPSRLNEIASLVNDQQGALRGLFDREEESHSMLQRHNLMLETVLVNLKALLGDKFIEFNDKYIPQKRTSRASTSAVPPSAGTDHEVDELDLGDLTPLERTPSPSSSGETSKAAPRMNLTVQAASTQAHSSTVHHVVAETENPSYPSDPSLAGSGADSEASRVTDTALGAPDEQMEQLDVVIPDPDPSEDGLQSGMSMPSASPTAITMPLDQSTPRTISMPATSPFTARIDHDEEYGATFVAKWKDNASDKDGTQEEGDVVHSLMDSTVVDDDDEIRSIPAISALPETATASPASSNGVDTSYETTHPSTAHPHQSAARSHITSKVLSSQTRQGDNNVHRNGRCMDAESSNNSGDD